MSAERLAAPAAAPASPSFSNLKWQSPYDQDHPLVGRVYEAKSGRAANPEEVAHAVARADFVLLGEKHDNADHHALQTELLKRAIAKPNPPAIVFEMFTTEQQDAIDAAQKRADTDGVAAAAEWDSSGWPPWPMYRPLVQEAIHHRARIVGAGIAPKQARALVRGEAEADPELRARFHLNEPLSGDRAASLRTELAASHCGHLPASMVEGMIRAQRARDATMASRMLAAGQAVLIAGAGHVRADRAVPFLLRQEQSGKAIVTIAFVEVQTDLADPQAYAARWGEKTAPFDFVWFTPRQSNEDPCEAFKKR